MRKKKLRRTRKVRNRDGNNFFGGPFSFGGLTSGGIVNNATGMGTGSDKSQSIFYEPTRVTTRTEWEILYAQSWAARNFIDIPIDDMFARWREFEDMPERAAETMVEQEKRFDVADRLARAMKAGQLYGTGILAILSAEAPLTKPLDISRIRPGDLINLLALDRFDLYVTKRDHDPYSKTYGGALEYAVTLKYGGTLHIHASRVLRFDGQKPLSQTGWYNYDQDWGVSSLIPAITAIHQEESLANGAAHLSQEASIPYMKIEGFEDAVSGNTDGDMTIADRGTATSMNKSLYRTIFMDSNDDIGRLEVSFNGWADIMDRNARRLAAIAGIPMTRFWGTSPVGMNATGEGDMRNYDLKVQADRQKTAIGPLEKLDKILAADAGITDEIKYTFPSLLDQSDEERAGVLDTKADAVTKLVSSGIIDENEARQVLDGDYLMGSLEEIELPEVDEVTPEGQTALIGDALPHGAVEKNGKIMFKPPAGAKNAAKKVLKWKEEHGSEVKGMTQVGWTRANQLASGELLSPATVARMSAFNRHKKNSAIDPKYKSEPWKDKGYVAWLGWGGNAGMAWAKRATEWYKERGNK